MRRLLRLFLLLGSALLSLIIVLLAAGIWYLNQLDVNAKRDQISQWLSQQIGWQITISEQMEYNWKQPDTLRVKGLIIEGPPVRIEIKRAQAKIKLHALLGGQVTISELSGRGIQILPPAKAWPEQAAASGSPPVSHIDFESVSAKDLFIDYPTPVGPLSFHIAQASGSALRIDKRGLAVGRGTAQVDSIKSGVGDFPLLIQQGEISVKGFQLAPNLRPAGSRDVTLQISKFIFGDTTLAQGNLVGRLKNKQLTLSLLTLQAPVLDYAQWFTPKEDHSDEPFSLSWLERIVAPQAKLTDLSLVNPKQPETLHIESLDLDVQQLDFPIAAPRDMLGQGQWQADEFRLEPYTASQIFGTLELGKGSAKAKVTKGKLLGGSVHGSVETTFTAENRRTDWQAQVEQLQVGFLDDLIKFAPTRPSGSLDVKLQGTLIPTMPLVMGFTMSSQEIVFSQFSLDHALDAMQNAEDLGRLQSDDVPLFLFLGPVGIIARQGVVANRALKSLKQSKKGYTRIEQLHLDGKMQGAEILFNDLGLATRKHRVAVRGSMDLNSMVFRQLIIAMLNQRGCATSQILAKGSYQQPTYELMTLKTRRCKPFYSGPVTQPE